MIQLSRKHYWPVLLTVLLVGCQPRVETSSPVYSTPSPKMTVLSQREYSVKQQLMFVNEGPGQPDKQNIWVALIGDLPPYQEVQSMEISPGDYDLIIDEYGNRYAEFDFSDHPAGTTKTIQIEYRVTVNELAYDLSQCEGETLDDFLAPELHIESANPQIVTLAAELSRGKSDACQKVHAFYDYLGDELVYSYNGNSWGAQAALGTMGADCTEYAALMTALSRAAGIPARYFEGLLYLDAETNEIARVEHAWVDAYLPGIGWVPLDPTLGRARGNREKYFARYAPDHLIVTMGPNPSTLRGSNYWTHLYWPGDSTTIRVEAQGWEVELIEQ